MRLLLIDDDENLVLSLYRVLAPYYRIETATTAKRGLQKITDQAYDVIVLDLTLPDHNGLLVCERIRAAGNNTPVLILSGLDETGQKVTLLDSGANDYLTKPFHAEELLARLRVLTRQPQTSRSHHRLTVGDLVLDRLKHQVSYSGSLIHLRPKEFAVLECLMKNSGSVVSREMLGNYAWSDEEYVTNTVDVHIKYLRDKIDRPFVTPLIRTVHGLGYKIDASH